MAAEIDPFAKYVNSFPPESMTYLPQGVSAPQGLVGDSRTGPTSANQASLDRYNKFLADQFIQQDTIGNAVTYTTSDPNDIVKMSVPSVAQEYAAKNANERDSVKEGRLRRIAADAMTKRSGMYNPAVALDATEQINAINAERGGANLRDRMAYFLAPFLRGAIGNANGFAR